MRVIGFMVKGLRFTITIRSYFWTGDMNDTIIISPYYLSLTLGYGRGWRFELLPRAGRIEVWFVHLGFRTVFCEDMGTGRWDRRVHNDFFRGTNPNQFWVQRSAQAENPCLMYL